ncbi:unnamed protein product [Linum tenue]|uniref:Uncharacterized protein n=1 Tax=Linum tenue TaxID=586396 RepID=A0AAV0Q1B5_9ROSI|nr:unnamed protein product [Linum tenue]
MLDENNILVQTFRTTRDRLNEGAIQQAHIRLLPSVCEEGTPSNESKCSDCSTHHGRKSDLDFAMQSFKEMDSYQPEY